MTAKRKNISTKVKKSGDLELLQKDWEASLEIELKELEELRRKQEKKLEALQKQGLSNLDIFKLKKIEELQKSKNQKSTLDQEFLFFTEQLTGDKLLKQDIEKLSKKIEDIKLVVTKLGKFDKNHFENERKQLVVLDYVRDLKPADIEEIKEEIIALDILWKKWNALKKDQISRKIKDKKLVLSYIQHKSEMEIEKLKAYCKRLKMSSRGKKGDEIYRELRMIPIFKNLKGIEIREILSKIDSELRENTSEELEKTLIKLQEMEQKTFTDLERGLSQFKLLPYLVNKLQKEDINISDENVENRTQHISNQFKQLRNSPIASKLRIAFKSLEGISTTEIVKKLNSFQKDKESLKNYKSTINKILKLSKGKELVELETLLSSLNQEYDDKLVQLREVEKKIKQIRDKSFNDISVSVKSLEQLYQLINERVLDEYKLDINQKNIWKEIQERVEAQMRQERELWGRKSNLKATSRNAAGVKGIDLSETDEIVSVSSTYDGENMVLIIDENGRGKCTNLSEYRISRWNSKGILSCKKAKSSEETTHSRSFENLIAGTLIDYEKDSLILWTEKGFLKRFKARDIVSTRKNRITSGNKLIELEKGDKIKKFTKCKNVEEGAKISSNLRS